MATFQDKLKDFSVELFKIDAVKFGEYKTKVGLMTPVYCDLRVIVSYPQLLDSLASLIIEYVKDINKFDIICGVPYTALPIATAVSLKSRIPMVMRRKEAKDYGTKKLIEGVFDIGDNCLIVEDVVTSGSSILETVKDVEAVGIKCIHAVVLLNREQGGEAVLEHHGIKMHALLSLSRLMDYLKEANCLDDDMVNKVQSYISSTQVDRSSIEAPSVNRLKMPFVSRIEYAKNPAASDLLKIMSSKETILCLAADLTNSTDLLNLAEEVGPYICALKTHVDIIEDFHQNLLQPLKEIAKRHNFLLFEDRKFADIGKTVQLQYSKGIYNISSWAQLVTAHALIGKGVLDAIKGCESVENRGVFLLAETSSSGNLIDEKYVNETINMAYEYPELITGIVCQRPLFLDKPGLIQLTPGVQLEHKSDNLGQQYNTPEIVVLERGADVAVVGRGITQAQEPAVAAEKYKSVLWQAYCKRMETN